MTDTNGRRRGAAARSHAAADAAAAAAEAEAAADAAADTQAAIDNDELDAPTSADYSVAFSPRQVAVGLAIVAGLVALVAARRRRGGRRQEG